MWDESDVDNVFLMTRWLQETVVSETGASEDSEMRGVAGQSAPVMTVVSNI